MRSPIDAFARTGPAERTAHTIAALAIVVWIVQFTLLSPWLIEDAAISLSYARNIGTGEGFVPTPGAEVVEGFSNPLWTLLLAAVIGLGLSGWTAVKLFGLVGGVVGIGVVYAWSRRLVGTGPLAALGPLLLATNAQWVIWRAAGLENPLFDALVLLGAWLWLQERDGRAFPWSAILLGLAAVTRPEGIAYGAVVGLFVLSHGVRAHGVRGIPRIALWAAVALAPWTAWEMFRLHTFAWPHPNTYYAKVDAIERSRPLDWDARSWTYAVRWALLSGAVAILPLVVASLVTLSRRRLVVAAVAVVLAGGLALTGLPALESWAWQGNEPNALEVARIGAIAVAAALLLTLSLLRPDAAPRSLAAALGLTGIAFAVWSGGDWMTGWRWMSPVAGPLVLLVTDGVASVIVAYPRRARLWVGWGLVPGLAGVGYFAWFLNHVDTTPFDIGRRVRYHEALLDRLGLRHALVLDIDQGGNQWWGSTELLDMAGLNDVAVAHHEWQKPFVEEYGYNERRPDIAHIHGSWADQTRFVHLRRWKEYISVPPYPVSRRTNHPGTWVHEDHVYGPALDRLSENWNNFGERLGLVWDLEADQAVPGGRLVVEGAVERLSKEPLKSFRLLVVVAGTSRLVAHDVAPGWDLVPVQSWRLGRSTRFHASIPIPADFPEGPANLAFAVFGEDGTPWRARNQRTLDGFGRFVRAESAWANAVRIVDPTEGLRLSADDRRVSARQAVAGNCEQAIARADAAEARSGADALTPDVAAEIGRCFAVRAEATTGMAARDAMRAARRWAHVDPVVQRTGQRLADDWEHAGDRALAQGDRHAAHDLWVSAMVADPTRTGLRRRLEANRDERLDIVEP